MIAHLSGTLLSKQPNSVILDVGGVGYEVIIPVSTFYDLEEPGSSVQLRIYTHVREDALDLYGFPNETERRVFRLLLGIPNVGPKTAIGVLSALSVAELARAITASDLGRLGKVPGIGKKTAERLVLELKDKLANVEVEGHIDGVGAGTPGIRGRLLSALTNMGYRPGEAEKAVASLGQRVDSAPLADLLKAALAELR